MSNDNAKGSAEGKVEETPALPTQAAAPGSLPINSQMPIQLVMTVEQINTCLAGLAKLPLEQSINTFQVLKGQGDMAIAVSQGIAAKAADVVKPNDARPSGRRRKTH